MTRSERHALRALGEPTSSPSGPEAEETTNRSTRHQPYVPLRDEQFIIRRTISLEAPIERFWSAISDDRELEQWSPDHAARWNLTPGGSGVFTWNGKDAFPIRVEAVNTPTYLAWTWGHENGSPGVTLVEWELEPRRQRTRLSFTESGIVTADHHTENSQGWDEELAELVDYVSRGPRQRDRQC
jgi:uncharacterized protein YndB with AHSA1/START domain